MNTYKILAICLCGWFFLVVGTETARAQVPASSFEELRSGLGLTRGDSIRITGDSGEKIEAEIAEIGDHTIAVTARGVRRDISESTVREITVSRHGNIGKGMLIGLVSGAGFVGVAALAICRGGEECGPIVPIAAVVYGGLGAGIGGAISWAIHHQETVYARPATTGSHGLTIAPILAKDKAGASLAFSF